jgi:hypothetical protein
VIDAAHAAAVIKAKDEHLRDLRELVMRQPVATSPVLAESVQAEPRHGSSVSLYFEDAEIGQQVADWITNVTRKASPE